MFTQRKFSPAKYSFSPEKVQLDIRQRKVIESHLLRRHNWLAFCQQVYNVNQ